MTDERRLRVASVQMEHTDGDKPVNFAKLEQRRPELYGPLTVPTGLERDTRELKFR
jgi:hypothetical protein